MNSNQLKVKILEENFPENSYSLLSSAKDETLCLQCVKSNWIVFYSERGLQTNKKIFDSEDEACSYFYQELSAWFGKNKV